ncbi:hypothetical protein HYW11_03870 [Candidatus Peregrinibacteria bacterium]|nr:hypothetical protein [Candidatus Peregrinibacteria bacterium]
MLRQLYAEQSSGTREERPERRLRFGDTAALRAGRAACGAIGGVQCIYQSIPIIIHPVGTPRRCGIALRQAAEGVGHQPTGFGGERLYDRRRRHRGRLGAGGKFQSDEGHLERSAGKRKLDENGQIRAGWRMISQRIAEENRIGRGIAAACDEEAVAGHRLLVLLERYEARVHSQGNYRRIPQRNRRHAAGNGGMRTL